MVCSDNHVVYFVFFVYGYSMDAYAVGDKIMTEFESFEKDLFILLETYGFEILQNNGYVYLKDKNTKEILFLDSLIVERIKNKKGFFCAYPLPESFKKYKDEDKNWS